jgi:hypothetical protein
MRSALPAALTLVLPTMVAAQQLHITPSFAVTETYDGNLFVSESDPQRTLLHRFGPRMEVERRTPVTSLVGRYELDAEYVHALAREGLLVARQLGSLTIHAEPTRRLVLEGDAAYIDTRSPTELGAVTTLDQGRIRAQRFSIGASSAYALNRRTHADLGYRLTLDDAAGLRMDAHLANAGLRRRFTRHDTGEVQALVREFVVDGSTRPLVEVLLLGWSRKLARRTSATVRAGPRFSGLEADGVEADAALLHGLDRTELEARYARTQTVSPGVRGPLETDSAALSATVTVRPSALRSSIGVSQSRGAAVVADVLYAQVAAGTRIHPWLEAELAVGLTWQRLGTDTASGVAGASDQSTTHTFHDVVALTLVVAPPEPFQLQSP